MITKPHGFSEAGLSTRNIEGWVDVLEKVGGWEVIWRGESPGSIKPLWDLSANCRVDECLMGRSGVDNGYIRFFQFDLPEQEIIREGAETWDSGGIFDLDIRVAELLPFVEELEQRGWQGISQPIDWQFGQILTREWITRGPEAVIIALMERLAPPLEKTWDGLQKFSHVFNSSQIVADMELALGFYRKLGFIEVMHQQGPFAGRGGEVLGLSPEEAPKTPVDLAIVHPQGTMEGSVELVKIDGPFSQDFAARAKPYNLGLNLLRFPVSDLKSFASQVEQQGLEMLNGGVVSSRLEPFGATEFMALQSPDGAWLEFYQQIN